MKRLPFQLLFCLALVALVAAPAVVSAALDKVYADGTCAVGSRSGADGTAAKPVCVGSPPDFNQVIPLLNNKTGAIIYIFSGGWCEFSVQNGDPGAPTSCSQGTPPGTGAPFAPALLWGVIGLVAIILVAAGLLFRRRGAASG